MKEDLEEVGKIYDREIQEQILKEIQTSVNHLSTIKNIIGFYLVIFCLVLIIGAYFILSNKSKLEKGINNFQKKENYKSTSYKKIDSAIAPPPVY